MSVNTSMMEAKSLDIDISSAVSFLFQCNLINIFNNRFLRERGMTSTLIMEYQIFLCIFKKNSAMASLGLKEMEKFLWEGRKKKFAQLAVLV